MTESSTEPAWKTAITEVAPNSVRVRGYDIAELMGNVSFGQAVYLILRGELPNDNVGRLMEAMLVASIDHGATPPSALAARTVASTGATLSAAVAAGISSINDHHGGAIEQCARQLGNIVNQQKETAESLDRVAEAVLNDLKRAGQRMAGFGHRIHEHDPRTARLFELAEQAGIVSSHMQAARAVEKIFAAGGRNLPINVDGAMGAILADLGFDSAMMNGLFMIARLPGLVAHVHEEKMRQKPMRRIDPVNHSYDGPAARSLPPSS